MSPLPVSITSQYAGQDVSSDRVGTAPIDAGTTQSVDPSQPGFVDPYASEGYQDSYDPARDAGAAPYETYGSAVAGTQPAVTSAEQATGPIATLDDFVALGIFTEAEINELANSDYSPQDLGLLYEESIAYMQSPEFAQQQEQLAAAAAADATALTGAPAGDPAWDDSWAKKYRKMMDDQGLDSRTQMMLIASMSQSPATAEQLEQGLEYYSTSPEGKAELAAAEKQVQAGKRMEDLSLFAGMGVATAVAVGAGAIGASKGNLIKALERTARGTGERAAIAASALDDIRAGRPLTAASRANVSAAMRAEAAATNRALHPIAKSSLNGAARHTAIPTNLTFKEAMQYGLGMKYGDVKDTAAIARLSDAPKGGAAVSAADDVARTAKAADSVDDVARAAGNAAKGTVGMLGKIARFGGPVGAALMAGVGAYAVSQTMKAEGGFGKESAKTTGKFGGMIAGGIGGAAAGAAIGQALIPIPFVGAGIGAVAGGMLGSGLLSKVGEGIGGFLHDVFN